MKVKDYNIKDLQLQCVDLLAKTYLQLGQKSDSETMITFATILCEDLQKDFKNLDFEDVKKSFDWGIRHSDEFHVSVRTYYKWIKTYRQITWDASYQVNTLGKPPQEVKNLPSDFEIQKLLQ